MTRFLALLAIIAMTVAACGGSGSEDTTAPEGGGGETATTAAEGGESSGGEGGGEQVELHAFVSRDYYWPPDAWEGFMAANPNIKVTAQTESNDDILQQLQRMQDAGQKLPDIIQDDTFLMEAYQNAGLLLDMTEQKDQWESEDPDTYNEILPIAWEENTFADGIWGVSLTANFDVIYYNIAMCEAAGVDCSSIDSLDGFLEAMRAVKASQPDVIPLTVQALPTTGVTTLKTFFSAAGAPFDGAVPDMQSEGGLYTIQWFLDASNEGLLPPQAISWGEDEARAAFAGQRAAFILDGFTVAGEYALLEGFDLGEQWGVIPSPVQGEGNQISNARTWAITSGTEHPYEAMLAIRHVGSVDQLVEAAAGGSVPMRNSNALADARLDEIWPFFDQTLRDAYAGSDSVPAGLNGGEVELVLEEMWGEIIVGTDKTAQELADQYQPILDGL
ncbi:MAG: extracellular solute-binding protein [Acidimicrobiia bacterium]|nr:extracellular solute-binding protein [Acidimicrobiia bacterium]MDH5294054.1 extracellular solute-binding protein [Acidimicrobiia bacterium]